MTANAPDACDVYNPERNGIVLSFAIPQQEIIFLSRETLTQQAGHMAWCALIALKLAQQEGLDASSAQQNLFLTRWLATALKQRRFHRDITPDMEWLLKQGRLYGVRAQLVSKLEYIWQAYIGKLSDQSDLFRLKYALETAQDMQWVYHLLSDREWIGKKVVKLNPAISAILLAKSALHQAFDETGKQTQPLYTRITGGIEGITALFQRCGWRIECVEETEHVYRLDAVTTAADEW